VTVKLTKPDIYELNLLLKELYENPTNYKKLGGIKYV